MALTALVTLAAFLPGCWSRREPEQLAIVTVAAFDRLPSGEVRWTVEIPLPQRPAAGGGQEGGGGGGPARLVVEAAGPTPLAAERALRRIVERELFWGHADFLLVGEQAARAGLAPLLDFAARRYGMRRNSLVYVTAGPAGDLLRDVTPGLERTMARRLRAMSRSSRPEAVPVVDVNTFLRWWADPGTDPFLPLLRARVEAGRRSAVLGGIALFREDRLVALGGDDAAAGVWWLRGSAPVHLLVVPCPAPARRDEAAGLRVSRASVRRRVGLEPAGRVSVAVWIRIDAELAEWRCPAPLDPAAEGLRRAAALRVRQQVQAAVEAMRRHGTDPAGIGTLIYRQRPDLWDRLVADWRRWLAALDVRAAVEVVLRDTGLTLGGP